MIEKELAEISFSELKKIWKKIKKFKCVIIGGWAAHLLINENFKKERNIEYIGSKDVDLAVLSTDLFKVFKVVESLNYFPLSFRYCKIYSRSSKKFISEKDAVKHPIHDLFYLFIDFLTDKKIKVNFIVFEDKIVKLIFENELFLEKNKMRILIPEVLVLSKLRMLKNRNPEKRMKDLIDALIVYSFYEDFKNEIFWELAEKFKFNKNFVRREIEKINNYLKLLGFSKNEIVNLKLAFKSLWKKL